jgi:hypothetical protein
MALNATLVEDELLRYAQKSAFREDARCTDNGAQVRRVTQLALSRGPSVDFGGYYQRHIKARNLFDFIREFINVFSQHHVASRVRRNLGKDAPPRCQLAQLFSFCWDVVLHGKALTKENSRNAEP